MVILYKKIFSIYNYGISYVFVWIAGSIVSSWEGAWPLLYDNESRRRKISAYLPI